MVNWASTKTRSLNSQPIRSVAATGELRGLAQERPFPTKARSLKRAASSGLAALERSVLQKINQFRQQKGLSSLSLNASMTQQARQHSQDMAKCCVLSHDGFEGRVRTISASVSYKAAAENVAYNQGFSNPVGQAVNSWLKSPGHLENIMGNYNITGIGVSKNPQGEFYFTQIFILR
jgi:uncharacterized protein YkwD